MAPQRPPRDNVTQRNYACAATSKDDLLVSANTSAQVSKSMDIVATNPRANNPTERTNAAKTILDDWKIYSDSDETLATSIQPSELASQLPWSIVLQLHTQCGPARWIFNYILTMLLEGFYLSKRTLKWKRDRHHRCKNCLCYTVYLKPHRTANMIEIPMSKPHTSMPEFVSCGSTTLGPLMSLEQAILEWIIDTLQSFVVVERPSFRRVFESIKRDLPLWNDVVVRSRIRSQLDDFYSSLGDDL